jgi:hypothetical protein
MASSRPMRDAITMEVIFHATSSCSNGSAERTAYSSSGGPKPKGTATAARRVLGRRGEGVGFGRRWKMDPGQRAVDAAGGNSPVACGLVDVRMAAANQEREQENKAPLIAFLKTSRD